MPHETSLIATIAVGLGLAFIGGLLANRLHLPPLVGYLLAGLAVGPFTPGFVADAEIAAQLAEIGVTDAKGQKPRAEAVRRAWWQVRRDLAAAKAKRQAGEAPEPVAVPYPDPVRLIRAPEQDDMPDAHQDDDPLPARRSDPPQEKITLKPSLFRPAVTKGE